MKTPYLNNIERQFIKEHPKDRLSKRLLGNYELAKACKELRNNLIESIASNKIILKVIKFLHKIKGYNK